MTSEDEAYQICKEIFDDPTTTPEATQYAGATLRDRLSGEALEHQMKYIAVNVVKESYQLRIAEWSGVDTETGYIFGYCKICGNTDGDNAYEGTDEDANGKVCSSCYDEFGGPDKCSDCGITTYDGDCIVNPDSENEFYCVRCL